MAVVPVRIQIHTSEAVVRWTLVQILSNKHFSHQCLVWYRYIFRSEAHDRSVFILPFQELLPSVYPHSRSSKGGGNMSGKNLSSVNCYILTLCRAGRPWDMFLSRIPWTKRDPVCGSAVQSRYRIFSVWRRTMLATRPALYTCSVLTEKTTQVATEMAATVVTWRLLSASLAKEVCRISMSCDIQNEKKKFRKGGKE